MKKAKKRNLSLAQKAEKALKEAVRHLVEEHRRNGYPLVVWKNGRVAKISARHLLRN